MSNLEQKKEIKKPARSKDRAQTEQRLICAAEKVFSKVGYEGATTRIIAQEAGINISLINRYFDGKYGLMVAVVRARQDFFKEQELAYPVQPDLRSELVNYGQFLIDRYLKEIHLIRICVSQFLTDAKFLKKFREVLVDRSFNVHLERRLKDLLVDKDEKFIHQVRRSVEDTETYAFGLILSNRIMLNHSELEIQESMDNFIHTHYICLSR
jgi:AcrR family transcriptional regulator